MNKQPARPSIRKLEKGATEFNHRIQVGHIVRYNEIRGEQPDLYFRTRTPAQVLHGNSLVVWLAGKSGFVSADHVTPMPDQAAALKLMEGPSIILDEPVPTPLFDVRKCRRCGCTDDDCSGCIERSGRPCHWVEEDLCSACAEEH